MKKKNERTINNFLTQKTGGHYRVEDVDFIKEAVEYVKDPPKWGKHKVALLFICLNPKYLEFARDAMEGADKFFLPGHDVDKFLWTDMPFHEYAKDVDYGATIFPTEGIEWPMPTLYRYHLFLQQEEALQDYDYVFYCDIDMRFVNYIGDEILGEGITAAQHPMYALCEKDNPIIGLIDKAHLYPPFEPNPESTAYVSYPKYYFAGGFQGGTTKEFLKMAKAIRKNIDKDFSKDYIAIWNDESHLNRYLIDNPPALILTPSFIYPDSMIEKYYKKIWGTDFPAKLITITKKFSLSAEGAEAIERHTKGT
ncbi:MAG: hypothetical protein U9O94_04380 [Nanoarchaeota archaeon]|nr:hypothetical protein [Nanoarchaeota archaeon]